MGSRFGFPVQRPRMLIGALPGIGGRWHRGFLSSWLGGMRATGGKMTTARHCDHVLRNFKGSIRAMTLHADSPSFRKCLSLMEPAIGLEPMTC